MVIVEDLLGYSVKDTNMYSFGIIQLGTGEYNSPTGGTSSTVI